MAEVRWTPVGEAVLLDALEMMVEQYMHLDEQGIYHHDFMSTGEYVSTLLPERRPEKWEKHRLGLRRSSAAAAATQQHGSGVERG